MRIALFGHCGAGKSSCLKRLNRDTAMSDMDSVLGNASLEEALGWLEAPSTPPIVVVGGSEPLLHGMLEHKERQGGRLSPHFLAVYLHHRKDELQAHLRKPLDDGRMRSTAGVEYTINNFERFDALYRGLCDYTVECGGLDLDTVAALVLRLSRQSQAWQGRAEA